MSSNAPNDAFGSDEVAPGAGDNPAPFSNPNDGAGEDAYNPADDYVEDHDQNDPTLPLGPDDSVASIQNFEIISGIETTVSVGRAAVAQIAEDNRTWDHTLKMVFDLTTALGSAVPDYVADVNDTAYGVRPQLVEADELGNAGDPAMSVIGFRNHLMRSTTGSYDFATARKNDLNEDIANQAIQPLADLFDQDEDKNELAGVQPSKSSLTYIKKAKVEAWLHTIPVAKELFTEAQLFQLLDAAADRGKFYDDDAVDGNAGKFLFGKGDTLSIIVRVVDSEAGNTRRWRIQLEQE